MMQRQGSVANTRWSSVEQKAESNRVRVIKPAYSRAEAERALNVAHEGTNFVDRQRSLKELLQEAEHRDVSAANLGDRFTEIRMDQYVCNFKGEREWCDDLIRSVTVRFLDKKGREIVRLRRDRRTSKRILRFAHPYTGKMICVKETVGDHVLFTLCDLGEEMFDVHFLHYSIHEDRGGLTRRDIVYSPQYHHVVDYLLSTWVNRSLPPGAVSVIYAARKVRGEKYWRHSVL